MAKAVGEGEFFNSLWAIIFLSKLYDKEILSVSRHSHGAGGVVVRRPGQLALFRRPTPLPFHQVKVMFKKWLKAKSSLKKNQVFRLTPVYIRYNISLKKLNNVVFSQTKLLK
jgi:hypothetical protein